MGKNKNPDNPFASFKINTSKNTKDNPASKKNIVTPNKSTSHTSIDNATDDSLFFRHMANVKEIQKPTTSKKESKKKPTAQTNTSEPLIDNVCRNNTHTETEDNAVKTDEMSTRANTKADYATIHTRETGTADTKLLLFKDPISDSINMPMGEFSQKKTTVATPNTFLEAFTNKEKKSSSQSLKTPQTISSDTTKNKHPSHNGKYSTAPQVVDAVNVANDELNAFYAATADVKVLSNKNRILEPQTPQVTYVPPPVNPLQDFLDAKTEFALHSTDEYVEAHVVGLDLMTVAKLQNRQYSPEAHIDLHGLNTEQAYQNLIAFFRTSYQRGHRMVLVVTGKGNNSINNTPILRTKVQEWFIKLPFKRAILAFCTAKQEDGGAGALYVLIRKQQKSYGEIMWEATPTDPDFFL